MTTKRSAASRGSRTRVAKTSTKKRDTGCREHPAFTLYLNSLAPSGRRSIQSTLTTAISCLDFHKTPTTFPWHTLTYEQVQRVRAVMLERGYAARSINVTLAAIRSVLRTSFQLEMVGADAVMRVEAVKPVRLSGKPAGRALTSAELRQLLTAGRAGSQPASCARDIALLCVAVGGGLRVSELVALNVDDIDMESGGLTVRSGKGRRFRTLHLPAKAVTAVRRWMRFLPYQSGPLWRPISRSDSVQATRLTASGIAHVLADLARRAEIDTFSPHDLRRTFITLLLQQGVDLSFVRMLAGHADVSTTISYDRRDASELKHINRQFNIGCPRAHYTIAVVRRPTIEFVSQRYTAYAEYGCGAAGLLMLLKAAGYKSPRSVAALARALDIDSLPEEKWGPAYKGCGRGAFLIDILRYLDTSGVRYVAVSDADCRAVSWQQLRHLLKGGPVMVGVRDGEWGEEGHWLVVRRGAKRHSLDCYDPYQHRNELQPRRLSFERLGVDWDGCAVAILNAV